MLNKLICIFILLFGICQANIPSWIKAPAAPEKSKAEDAPNKSEKSEKSDEKPTKPPKKKKQKTKNSVLQVENIYQTVKLEPPPVNPGIFSLENSKMRFQNIPEASNFDHY